MATDATPIVAVLLAGGESRRMGTPKALLDFRGRPLWRHIHDLLLTAGCGRVLVSGNFPQDIPQAIPDTVTGRGPLAGIAAVAATLADCTLLVTPVDLPLLDAATLQALLRHDPQAAALHYATHALPVRLRCDQRFRTALAIRLDDPDPRRRSLQALAAALHAAVLPLTPAAERALTNVNTPEEWRRALLQS